LPVFSRSAPSAGVRRRIRNLGQRNDFTTMAEIIVTVEDTRTQPLVQQGA
jgi:hypothetical protein